MLFILLYSKISYFCEMNVTCRFFMYTYVQTRELYEIDAYFPYVLSIGRDIITMAFVFR